MEGRAFLGGALLGTVVAAAGAFAWITLRSPEPPAPGSDTAAAPVDETRDEIERLRRELAEARSAATSHTEPAPVAAPAPAAALQAHPPRKDGLAERSARIRASAEKTIADADRLAQAQLDQEALQEAARKAEEARRAEDLARGGTMEFLRGLEKKWVAPWDLLTSDERYAALFERRAAGPTLDGVTASLKEPVEDGAVLRFPAGRHTLDLRSLGQWERFPADLLVVGQGMDATLLVVNQCLRARTDIRSLTFRDATIFTSNNPLTDLREGAFTIALERCRVIGFDNGAGGSELFSGRVGAVRAEDCQFEVGYGRAPSGYANMFTVSRALLVRMDRCRFRGGFNSVYDDDKRNAYRFHGCQFLEMPDGRRAHLEKPPATVRFEECKFEYLPAADPDAPPERLKPKPLTDINPDWVEKPK